MSSVVKTREFHSTSVVVVAKVDGMCDGLGCGVVEAPSTNGWASCSRLAMVKKP